MIELVSLVDRPDLAGLTARWCWEQWSQAAGRALTEDIARCEAIAAAPGFEQGFVVLNHATPAAMAFMVRSDLDERPNLTPWLAGVYVDTPFRGRGYARQVVRRVEQAAIEAEIRMLWLYTSTAAGLYQKLGWLEHEPIDLPKGRSVIFRRELGDNA